MTEPRTNEPDDGRIDTSDRPICGCSGCTATATLRIDHDKHGQMVVCDFHSTGYDVVEILDGRAR